MSRGQRLVRDHDRGDTRSHWDIIWILLCRSPTDSLTSRRLTTARSFEVEEIYILRTGKPCSSDDRIYSRSSTPTCRSARCSISAGRSSRRTPAEQSTGSGVYIWSRPADFAWIDGQEVRVSANLAPAPESATVDGTSLVLTHSEDLDTNLGPGGKRVYREGGRRRRNEPVNRVGQHQDGDADPGNGGHQRAGGDGELPCAERAIGYRMYRAWNAPDLQQLRGDQQHRRPATERRPLRMAKPRRGRSTRPSVTPLPPRRRTSAQPVAAMDLDTGDTLTYTLRRHGLQSSSTSTTRPVRSRPGPGRRTITRWQRIYAIYRCSGRWRTAVPTQYP